MNSTTHYACLVGGETVGLDEDRAVVGVVTVYVDAGTNRANVVSEGVV